MSLLSVLKTVGKDLGDVGKWVGDGLAAAGPIVTVVDPPLGTIFTAIDGAIAKLEASGQPITADSVQTTVTSTAKAAATSATAPAAMAQKAP